MQSDKKNIYSFGLITDQLTHITRNDVNIYTFYPLHEATINCYFRYSTEYVNCDDLKFPLCMYALGLAGVLSVSSSLAQSPQKINYQAVARNVQTGLEFSDQTIFLIVKITIGSPGGSIVYQETHEDVSTDSYGLFNLQIGDGNVQFGNLSAIAWENGTYWISVDVDTGAGLENAGSMQLISVPYALHAETVSDANDADADPTNELISGLNFDSETYELSITESGKTLIQDLSSLAPENFVNLDSISAFQFDDSSNILSITESGNIFELNLSELIDDADADPANELITSFSVQGQNITIQEGDLVPLSVNIAASLLDDDPNNELITTLNLFQDTLLQITEGGIPLELNLASLRDDHWKRINTTNTVYNVNDNIGIGTSAPVAKLHITADANEMNELLRIQGAGTQPRIMVSSDQIGIGTDNPNSTFEVNGSVGYRTKLLNNELGSLIYDVSEQDHIIICIVQPPAVNTITINMPPADICEGRVITIRKTGLGPFVPDVIINFGGFLLDFTESEFELDANQRETAQFISLGSNGWTKLFEE